MDCTFYIYCPIVKMVSKVTEIIPSQCSTEILNRKTADPSASGFIIIRLLHIVGFFTEFKCSMSLHPPVGLASQVANLDCGTVQGEVLPWALLK